MEIKLLLQNMSLWLYLFWVSAMMGASIYQKFVCFPVWQVNFPDSLVGFFRAGLRPSVFWSAPVFRPGPLFGIAAVILHWGTGRQDWVIGSVGLGIVTMVVTLSWFIPRLKTMGLIDGTPNLSDPGLLHKNLTEWLHRDKFRLWLLVIPAFFLALAALSIPV